MNKFFVYILHSVKHNRHYIGHTKDLEVRLKFHNSNQARWTKRFQPWIVAYSEQHSTRADAMKREKELKKLKDVKAFLNKVFAGIQ